jgi:WD40 repeat protein
LQCRHSFDEGGVAIAEMLFSSNLMAVVGGGPLPKFPPNKVLIWDDHQKRPIGELAFKTPVRAVKLRNNRISVALEQKIYLYDIEDLHLLNCIETTPNPEGFLALSPSQDATVLACPGLHIGEVRVERLDDKKIKTIKACTSPLAALTLSTCGKYLATASEKGTLIRVFSTIDAVKVREFRRGSDPARIYSLAFSRTSAATRGASPSLENSGLPEWLAVSSDKGTVHVFNLTGKISTSATSASGEHVGWEQEEERSGGGGGSSSSSPTKPGSGRLVLNSLSSFKVCFTWYLSY